MQEPTGTHQDDQGSKDLSATATVEQEHEHQPQNTPRDTDNPRRNPYRWIKAHWQQLEALPTHDKLNLFFTFIIALATTIYVIVASLQLGTMRRQTQAMQSQLTQMQLQLPQIQKSTKAAEDSVALTRQQVIATQAAVLDFRFDVFFQPSAPSGLRSMIYAMSGNMLATDIHLEGDASWVTFPQLQPISSQPFKIDMPQFRRGDAGVHTIPLKGLTLEKWQPIQTQTVDKTIEVKGAFSYNNGFDPVPSQPFCFVWYAHPVVMGSSDQEWVHCDDLKPKMSYFAFLEKKAAETKK